MSTKFEAGGQAGTTPTPPQPGGATEAEVRITAAYVAAVFSGIALIVACVALGLSLRPRTTTAAPPVGQAASTRAEPSAHCPAAAGLPSTANDHGAAPTTGTSLNVEAGDFFFSPTCELSVRTGSTVTLTVHNSGQALHNVTFSDQGIDADVAPGQTVTVNVKVGAAGTYAYFCKYHRTSGMVGTLVAGGT